VTAVHDSISTWLRRPLVGATLFLTASTMLLTWPQVLYLGSRVPPYPDPRLSIWRLSWLAHALRGDAPALFDGNIFYPNPGTFAYSDATFLEGLLATPWLWMHANSVAVYNVLLLAGIISSGIGMFVLVRYLTSDPDAALISAAVFTLAPYRIEHYMHLELQWTVWMPLSLWAVHRAFDRPSWRVSLWFGLLLSLQMLSGVYYAVFLGLVLGVLTLMLAMARPATALPAIRTLAVGSVLPAIVTAVYSRPYIANAKLLGPRAIWDISLFSARPGSYLAAPQENWLWGWTAWGFTGNELHLFPGAVAVVLALLALTLTPRRLAWMYAVLTAVAVELSLGLNGWFYSFLYAHVSALSGFRAPARFSILACCALAVLAGLGYQSLRRLVTRPGLQRALFVGVLVAIGIDCGSAPMRLEALSTTLPDGYKFLRTVSPSVIVELPFEDWELAPDYMYWSTYHWNSLVNGYSGYHPRSYAHTIEVMRTFPDARSVDLLKSIGVRFVVVHQFYYTAAKYTALMTKIAQTPDLVLVGRFKGIEGSMQIFELKR
jgi:hypothetical protein